MNSSKWTSWLGVQKRRVSWPDGYNLTGIKCYAVHLGDEDGCDGLVQSCSVHVDGGTNREHETSDSLVDGQVLFQAAEGDGKGSSADGGRGGGKRETSLGYFLCELRQPGQSVGSLEQWPGGCAQGSDPGLEDAEEEGEGVFPDDNEVDAGQEDGSVDDEADDHSHHIHAQLPGDHLQVLNGDDLTADETGDTEGRVPVQAQRLQSFP